MGKDKRSECAIVYILATSQNELNNLDTTSQMDDV